MFSKFHLIAAVSLLGLFGIAPGTAAAGFNSSSAVFIILMENENWSSIKGSASAPYINNTLLPMASYAEQYYNPPGNHPSLPNYLWLEAGTNFGILNDNPPSANHQSTANHFVTYLKNAGISWKTYQENITGTTCPTTDSPPYYVKHNPFAYFDDIVNNYCLSAMRPYTELAGDLSNQTVSHYNFITPNICDDMHDSCAPTNNPIKQGDTWLSQNVPMIMQSAAYQNNGLLIISWDEAVTGDGPIGLIVLSPLAKGGGYHNSLGYTHSSTLRTFQKIFGVTPFLGGAATGLDLSDLFMPGAIPNGDPQAVSRKVHGSAGTFDIDLELSDECRSGGPTNDYQIVLTFPSAVTFSSAAVTAGTGSVSSSSGSGTASVTVNLTGVSNAQNITLTLSGVSDGTGTTGSISVPMGVLIGDTTGDGAVNAGDIGQTKSQSGNAVTASNFREDVTVDGSINAGDIGLVKSKSGTGLP
ncbi:MAG: alkaline phosphatase family protein [Chthoniobacterales bacterium]